MNFSDLVKFANQASAFELYRLRVAYAFLHRVLDSDGSKHDVIEIGGTWVQPQEGL